MDDFDAWPLMETIARFLLRRIVRKGKEPVALVYTARGEPMLVLTSKAGKPWVIEQMRRAHAERVTLSEAERRKLGKAIEELVWRHGEGKR